MVSNQVDALKFIQSFLKIPRVWHEAPWFGKSLHDKTKQNKLPCFIDRFKTTLVQSKV